MTCSLARVAATFQSYGGPLQTPAGATAGHERDAAPPRRSRSPAAPPQGIHEPGCIDLMATNGLSSSNTPQSPSFRGLFHRMVVLAVAAPSRSSPFNTALRS